MLFLHDCVIIPGMGGFVGQYQSSDLHEATRIFIPPVKTISFNKHLINDDGLLIHELASKQGLDYAKASELVTQYVEDLKKELAEKHRVELEKIGTLYTESGIIKFIPSDTNFSIQHIGLPVVKAVKIEKKKVEQIPVVPIQQEKSEKVEEKPIVELHSTPEKSNKNWWWAVAVLIPILFYSAWVPMKTGLLTNPQNFHYSDLNPFTFQKVKQYKPLVLEKTESIDWLKGNTYSNTEVERVDLDRDTYLYVGIVEPVQHEADTTYVELPKPKKEIKKNNGAYHLIGGCFSKKENANNFIEKMKNLGYDAKIIDTNKGLFRVSVGDFFKRKKAKEIKQKLKEEQDISSWILKK